MGVHRKENLIFVKNIMNSLINGGIQEWKVISMKKILKNNIIGSTQDFSKKVKNYVEL